MLYGGAPPPPWYPQYPPFARKRRKLQELTLLDGWTNSRAGVATCHVL